MTSKISSAKLLKESVRRNGALGVLLILVWFCYFPVGSLLVLNDRERAVENGIYAMRNMDDFLRQWGGDNGFLFFVTAFVAFVLALIQFSYLHSQDKTDFYHSLPVRREKLFAIQYLAGVLIWLVPYAAGILTFALICLTKGYMGSLLFAALIKSLAVHIVCFLLVYSVMILVMMVTGKLFAAILGFAVACGYVPAILLLIDSMIGAYFLTGPGGSQFLNTIFIQFSPLTAVLRIMAKQMEREPILDILLAVLMVSALITGLCVYLYRRRPSESAGKTMAFKGIARVVKFLLVVPIALYCMLFFDAASNRNPVWSLFGLILGLLIFSALIEFIYYRDMREVFRDKLQLAVTAAVVLAIAAEFVFDLTGYDKWLPEADEVAYAEIQSYAVEPSYRDEMNLFESDGQYIYEWAGEEQKNVFRTEDVEAVLEMARHNEALEESDGTDEDDFWGYVSVGWHMKDGKVKTRHYQFYDNDLLEYFAPIWESQECRTQRDALLSLEAEDILAVTVMTAADSGSYMYGDVVMTDELRLLQAADEDETEETAGDLAGETKLDENGEAAAGQTDASEGVEYADIRGNLHMIGDKNGTGLTAQEIEKLFPVFQRELGEQTLKEAVMGSADSIYVIYRDKNQKIYGETIQLSDGFSETCALLEELGFEF